ncbi:Protein KAKU4 [Carex littledalei]|uniref:Protein KAKU4 n=1 Tax=Carex littledalei TaxID=544730 RepID=A0A833VGD4_9POAL|nr:Protein KAKU4 [Carex littledalei]
MASFFKGRGEGWTPPANDSSPAPNENNKKWISGLVSGAGKIISSVFRSSDASDSEFEEDDAEMLSSDEKEDDTSHKKLVKLNQESAPGQVEETNTIIIPPTSKSKINIQQLITKETFTREESEKLIKLIESRVEEASYQKLEYAPFSTVEVSPEMRSMAIAESKKWLEEKKKSTPSSSKTIDLGPCKFNTDMPLFEIESDIGSPVDLAKSYMQSKPPWQSPFLTSSSTLFSTPPSGSSKFSGGFIQGTFDHSLSSSRFLKRDYISTGLWDPKEETSRRVRSRLSGSAFDSISSFTGPGSTSGIYNRDVLDPLKSLNFSLLDDKAPSHADVIVPPSQAGTAEGMVNTLEPTLGNNVLLESQQVAEKEQRITEETAVNVNKETGSIAEVVILETSNPIHPTFSEKNDVVGQDQNILTDEQGTLEGSKSAREPENFADASFTGPKQHGDGGDLHITNSLHGSTNKSSANGPAVHSNMESEFESSINGGPTSSTVGPDVSDDKSLNGSDTGTGLKTPKPDATPIRKGRKRVVSGRSRGRGRGKVRGTT